MQAIGIALWNIPLSMHKIIVPSDFSNNAMLAASYAARIAAKFGATIYLLHAMDAATDPILEPVALDTKFLHKYTLEEFDRLRSIRNRISEENPQLKIELRLAKGLAADAILSFSHTEQADLIVIGAHGSGALKEFFIGSVTSEIIAKSRVPVTVVPPEYRFHEAGPFLLATKKFEESKGTLLALVELAEVFKAPVHVVSFIDEGEGQAGQYLDVTWHLNHYLEFLQRSFQNVTFLIHRLEGNDLQESIDEYCRQHDIDMVAVLNHPRTLIDKVCRRNNSRRTVFHSRVPVLVLPGQ
jgi:nucleotide-binding universal stress UspA family protein